MAKQLWERAGFLMGIAFVVLLFAGEVVLGDATHPPANAPGEKIVAFFTEYRTGSLIGAHIQALATMLLLWFVATLATALAAWGQRTTAVLVAAGGTVSVGVFMVYLMLSSALAFGADSTGGLDPGAAGALYQARFMALVFYALPVSVLVAATSVGALHTGLFPRWYGRSGIIVAVAFLVGGADVARNGLFSPDGDYGFILFWLFPLWLIVTGVVFMRRTGEARQVENETPVGGMSAPWIKKGNSHA
ncbi:MAG TPA: hypothetical protein VF068_00795 [Rubrobacter sp.]